jgi:hypothetical protein
MYRYGRSGSTSSCGTRKGVEKPCRPRGSEYVLDKIRNPYGKLNPRTSMNSFRSKDIGIPVH